MLLEIEFVKHPFSKRTWSTKCESFCFLQELRDLVLTKLQLHADTTASHVPVIRKFATDKTSYAVDTETKSLFIDVNKVMYTSDDIEIEIVTVIDGNVSFAKPIIDNTSITELCNILMST